MEGGNSAIGPFSLCQLEPFTTAIWMLERWEIWWRGGFGERCLGVQKCCEPLTLSLSGGRWRLSLLLLIAMQQDDGSQATDLREAWYWAKYVDIEMVAFTMRMVASSALFLQSWQPIVWSWAFDLSSNGSKKAWRFWLLLTAEVPCYLTKLKKLQQ